MLECSIGIMAYNEERNISKILHSLINQKEEKIKIAEIVVVSSACTDRTDDIVKEFAKKDKRIKLVCQETRGGKVKAINDYLKLVKYPIVVMESADTIPSKNTIENICLPFIENERIGVVGGHPLPANNKNTFMGFVSHMQWELHHRASTMKPKCGEILAIRNLMRKIPTDLIIDDAYIELFFEKKGYKVAYAPSAVVKNKGPETIKDFIKRRRNLATGFFQLKEKYNYIPSTQKTFWLIGETLKITGFNIKKIFWSFCVMILNWWATMLGGYDYYVKKKYNAAWEIATSTKELKKDEI